MSLHPLKKCGLCLSAIIFLLSLFCDSGIAATMDFPGGQTVDLTTAQFNQLKRQPGIFYVRYPSQTLIPAKTTERVVVEVPESLGGGFLIAFSRDYQKGLAAIAAIPVDGLLPAQTDLEPNSKPEGDRTVQTEFTLDGAYRVDRLKWNIAGDNSGHNPNILSELTWEDLRIFQLRLSNTTLVKERVYLRGYASYGWIQSGDNRDSDYLADNRTLEWSRSDNATDDDDVLDGSLGIGYRFALADDRIVLIPLIGYSYHEQNLRITDGYQTIPPTGSFAGLDSTYETRWHGPWLGIDFKAQTPPTDAFVQRWVFFTTLELHYADYYAEADWNLRPDFAHPKSFEHDADGFGVLFKIGTQLFFTKHWALNIAYDYAYWKVEDGTDRVFFADGTRATTRLNEVVWRSHVFSLGTTYQF